MDTTLTYSDYIAARYALVDEYWNGHITFPQYCDKLATLELRYWFGLN